MYPGLSQKPRLMILTDAYPPPGIGGAPQIAYYQAKAFKDIGWEVAVVCSLPRGIDSKPTVTDEEGIKVYRIFQLYPITRKVYPSTLDKALGMAMTFRNPLMTKVIHSAIDSFNPQILHAHHISRISYDVFANVSPQIPRVLTFHTYHFECPKGGLYRKRKRMICEKKPLPCKYFEKIMQQALNPVDRIIAISHFIERRLIHAGYNPGKVQYIPNGVPDFQNRLFSRPSKSRELLYVGRLDHNKGLSILIKAFERISDDSLRLTIVGDGPTWDETNDAIANDSRIQCVGWKDSEEITDYYKRSRIVVVPSIWHEVMNTVICEAQSWGRAVIATDVGGNSDLIKNGEDGFLVSAGDIIALHTTIQELLNDDKKTDEFGRKGFESVKRYSMSRHISSLEKLYESIPSF